MYIYIDMCIYVIICIYIFFYRHMVLQGFMRVLSDARLVSWSSLCRFGVLDSDRAAKGCRTSIYRSVRAELAPQLFRLWICKVRSDCCQMFQLTIFDHNSLVCGCLQAHLVAWYLAAAIPCKPLGFRAWLWVMTREGMRGSRFRVHVQIQTPQPSPKPILQ